MLGITEVMKLMGSNDGKRLLETVKRLIDAGELTVKQVAEHLDRLERVGSRTGKTIKAVADEALDLYESQL